MNHAEINGLMEEISKCKLKLKLSDMIWIHPNPPVYDSLADGFKLGINPSALDDSDLHCIEAIAQKRKLKLIKITENSHEYFVIYKPREKS